MSPTDFDLVVIGSGAGGGTLATRCARGGRRVLLVERGPAAFRREGETATLIEKRPYDDRAVELQDTARRLYMGGTLGGGTSVYGGALLRPAPSDFQPGRHYGPKLPRALWEWPVSYDELEPFYDEAEALFGVARMPGDEFKPLAPPCRCDPSAALPLAPINARLVRHSRVLGLQPFRLPLAIRADACLRCDHCAGFVCPTGARRSTAQLVGETLAGGFPLTVWSGREAERFERNGRAGVGGVWIRDRSRNTSQLVRGRRYVLAAGAIGSSILLLKSGFDSPLIGRHYMMHYSPLAVGFFARPTGDETTFLKQVGFADYYHGTEGFREKMGIIQSLPTPGEAMLAKAGLGWVPRPLLRRLRWHLLPLVGIIEDLPDPANRVTLTTRGSIRLEHRFSNYDQARGAALGRAMRAILRGAGAVWAVSGQLPSKEHVAHQCGTLRFGTAPDIAVADRDGRVFGIPNLFVADGSVLPTSLGVGPSLTIMAHALRVARHLLAEI